MNLYLHGAGMYLKKYNQHSMTGLGKQLAGSMIEQNPFTSPGYYISTVEFSEGRGPNLGELSAFNKKINETIKKKYGDDTLEIGYLVGQLKGQAGEVIMAPQRLRNKEYVFGSLKFKKDRAFDAYPEDLNKITEETRLTRAYCISWVKKSVNVNKALVVPDYYTITLNPNGTTSVSASEKRHIILKKFGLTPKPKGEVSFGGEGGESFIYIEWYDKNGALVYITGTAKNGSTRLWTPEEFKKAGLNGIGSIGMPWYGYAILSLGVVLVAGIAFFSWVCKRMINEFITCVDPDTGKEIESSVMACLLLKAGSGIRKTAIKIGKGIGIGLAVTIPILSFFKWGLPAIKKYKEQKQIGPRQIEEAR
jgi:hypothetical protein